MSRPTTPPAVALAYSVHHGVTGSRYGEAFGEQGEAERYARKLSATVGHTLSIRCDGAEVAFAYRGEVTPV